MHRMDTSRRKQVYQSTNLDQMCLRKGSIPQSKIYTDHQHYNFCWKTLSLSIYVNTTGDLGRAHRGPHLTKHSADLLPDNTGHHQSTVGPTNAWSCGIQWSWQPGWHLELSSGQCHCCWGGVLGLQRWCWQCRALGYWWQSLWVLWIAGLRVYFWSTTVFGWVVHANVASSWMAGPKCFKQNTELFMQTVSTTQYGTM